MTIRTAPYISWASSGLDPLLPIFNTCSPNLLALNAELNETWPVWTGLGCHADRPVRAGSAPSVHSWGAATDRGYPNRAVGDAALAWMIANSEELGIQSIHDYLECRIWHCGRTADPTDAFTLWWRDQVPNVNNGMGQSWATYFHIETYPTRWADSRPIDDRFPQPETDMRSIAPYRAYDTRPGEQFRILDELRVANAEILDDGPLRVGAGPRTVVLGVTTEASIHVTGIAVSGQGYVSVNDIHGNTSPIILNAGDPIEAFALPNVITPNGRALFQAFGTPDFAVDFAVDVSGQLP